MENRNTRKKIKTKQVNVSNNKDDDKCDSVDDSNDVMY